MKRIWSGTISFGLVNIPINLYSAVNTKKLKFDYLHEDDKCKIGYTRICKETGEEVPYEEIVTGYEYTKGDYVIVTDEDFENANVKIKNSIEILNFTDEVQIDSKYYQKPYFLEPEDDSMKMYALLRKALTDSEKVGVARYVLRTKEHLGIVKAEQNVLMLNQIRFADEIRDTEGLNIPGAADVGDRELSLAVKIIEQLSEDFEPKKYKDTYTQDLLETIQEKVEKKVEIKPRGVKPEPTSVDELMKRLKESLNKSEDGKYASI